MSNDVNWELALRDELAKTIQNQLQLSDEELVLVPLPGKPSTAEQYSIELPLDGGALTIDISDGSIELYNDECVDNPQSVDLADPTCLKTLEEILSSFGVSVDLNIFFES